jgi:hypothetical protein
MLSEAKHLYDCLKDPSLALRVTKGTEADMVAKQLDEPRAAMEKALIEEYLLEQGYSLEKLKELPEQVAKQLMKEASKYASLKLEEIEARAHLVEEIHDKGASSD